MAWTFDWINRWECEKGFVLGLFEDDGRPSRFRAFTKDGTLIGVAGSISRAKRLVEEPV